MSAKPITQKEIKKNTSHVLENSLTELRAILGDKKFNNRVKKAVKLLTEGIEKKKKESAPDQEPQQENVSADLAPKKAPARKKAAAPAVPKAVKRTKAPVAKKKAVSVLKK